MLYTLALSFIDFSSEISSASDISVVLTLFNRQALALYYKTK